MQGQGQERQGQQGHEQRRGRGQRRGADKGKQVGGVVMETGVCGGGDFLAGLCAPPSLL